MIEGPLGDTYEPLEAWQESLIERHMEFARKGARRYFRMCRGRYSFDELESAAMLGLVESARRFDLSYGVQFTTYAFTRIDMQLRQVHIKDRMARGARQVKTLADQEKNLAEGKSRFTMRQRVYVGQWPMTEDGDMLDIPGPDRIPDMWRRIELRSRLRFCLSLLKTKRERVIFLGQLKGDTLRETGQRLGISHERVRQLWGPIFERLKADVRDAGLSVN